MSIPMEFVHQYGLGNTIIAIGVIALIVWAFAHKKNKSEKSSKSKSSKSTSSTSSSDTTPSV